MADLDAARTAAVAIETGHGGDNAAVASEDGRAMIRVDLPSSEVNAAQATAAEYGFRLVGRDGSGSRWRDRYVFADGGRV